MIHLWSISGDFQRPLSINPAIQCSQGTAGCTALESNFLVSLPSPPSSLKRRWRPRGSPALRRGTQRRIVLNHGRGMARLFSSAARRLRNGSVGGKDVSEFVVNERPTPKHAWHVLSWRSGSSAMSSVFKWRKLEESRGGWKDGSDGMFFYFLKPNWML